MMIIIARFDRVCRRRRRDKIRTRLPAPSKQAPTGTPMRDGGIRRVRDTPSVWRVRA